MFQTIFFFKFSRQKLKLIRVLNIYRVPEVPGDLPEKHSMSRADEGFPAFTDINGEQCVSALGKLTLEYETGFWKLEDKIKGKVYKWRLIQ